MNKIEHIGIAVKDLAAANEVYAALLGVAHYKTETVESEGVNTSFFKAGPNKIELLEATNPESTIAKFIAKKGEGVHHIAFAVSDIKSEIARFKNSRICCVKCNSKKRCRQQTCCLFTSKNYPWGFN